MLREVSGLVSTIIPVHNRPGVVREAIESVLAQRYEAIEVIVVDDGSTDETGTVIDDIARAHPGLVHALHIENGGPGVAREAGRQMALGEFIQYLDSDDLLLPDKFAKQVRALRDAPECGVAYGMTRFYHVADGPRDVPWKRTGERIETMFPSFLESRWWGTSTPLYRRSITDRAGVWLPLINEEDWEYDCRIAAMGTRIAYVDEYVSDQRHDGALRLSSNSAATPRKLRDRVSAHLLILDHAHRAGIDSATPEMRRFARELFLLARQCCVLDLSDEALAMLDASRRAWPESWRHRMEVRLFRALLDLAGTRRVGKMAKQYENRLRRRSVLQRTTESRKSLASDGPSDRHQGKCRASFRPGERS